MSQMTSDLNTNLTIQQMTQFPDAQYKCQQCSRCFKKKSKLQRHINQSHLNIKPFKCSECLKQFKRSHHLQRHEMSHSNLRTFKCSSCIASFNSKDHLVRHIKFMHLRQYLKCEECGEQFMKKRSFRKHQKQHKAQKGKVEKIGKKIVKEKMLYICNIEECRLPFAQYYSLRRHIMKAHKLQQNTNTISEKSNTQNKSIISENNNQQIYISC